MSLLPAGYEMSPPSSSPHLPQIRFYRIKSRSLFTLFKYVASWIIHHVTKTGSHFHTKSILSIWSERPRGVFTQTENEPGSSLWVNVLPGHERHPKPPSQRPCTLCLHASMVTFRQKLHLAEFKVKKGIFFKKSTWIEPENDPWRWYQAGHKLRSPG